MLFKERQHSVIEQIRNCNRSLAIVELGNANLAVGINKRLLIDPSPPLESSYIEGVLSSALPGTFALEFPVRLFILLGFL